MRHVGIAVAALVASGCNSLLGIDDLSLRDAATDTSIEPEHCYGTLAMGCFPLVPTGALTLTGNLDTGTDVRCSNGPTCAIGADTLTVDTLTVSGTRPLVLVALTTLTITGRLEAGSTLNRLGPGANSPDCGPPVLPTVSVTSGGGAGGSFGGLGAAGGNGSGGGGSGGTPGAIQTPTALRGGCRGSDGGGAANFGAGGNGGGAVALYAGVKIQINQDITVSGAGAGAALNGNTGGGGGGSGGMVILEAPAIDVANDVFANGGGGGEGANTADDGVAGAESTAYDSQGNGGSGGSGGGDGGDGFALAMPAQTGNSPGGGGGGGGGGGAGVIWVKGTITGTKISPTATIR